MMYRNAAVLIALGVVVAGCAGNDGEATTCRDFNGMSQDARGAAVARMLKQRSGLNGSTNDVAAQVQNVAGFCSSNGNGDKTIGDAR